MSEHATFPPDHESDQGNQAAAEEAVQQAALFLLGIDVDNILARVPDEKGTPDGDIYLMEPSDLFDGDLAVVDARNTPLNPAHFHENGEWDAVIVLKGELVLVRGMEEIPMKRGDVQLVPPGVTHFVISRGGVFGALGYPSYNPDNQKEVDPLNPPADFHSELYATTASSLQQ